MKKMTGSYQKRTGKMAYAAVLMMLCAFVLTACVNKKEEKATAVPMATAAVQAAVPTVNSNQTGAVNTENTAGAVPAGLLGNWCVNAREYQQLEGAEPTDGLNGNIYFEFRQDGTYASTSDIYLNNQQVGIRQTTGTYSLKDGTIRISGFAEELRISLAGDTVYLTNSLGNTAALHKIN